MNTQDAYEFGFEVGDEAAFSLRNDVPRQLRQFEYLVFCAQKIAEQNKWKFRNHLWQFGIEGEAATPFWREYFNGVSDGIHAGTIDLLEDEG